jgi:hypothetical protein
MIGLDEAKEVIRRADPAGTLDEYSEADPAVVYQEGWRHLGDDHFYNESTNQVAGPMSSGSIRIVVALSVRDRNSDVETSYDLALEWDRQVGTDPLEVNMDAAAKGATSKDYQKRSSGKCACDM